MSGNNFDEIWGHVSSEGRLNVKTNEVSYTSMSYNLRRRAIFFYPLVEVERQEKEQIMVHFT